MTTIVVASFGALQLFLILYPPFLFRASPVLLCCALSQPVFLLALNVLSLTRHRMSDTWRELVLQCHLVVFISSAIGFRVNLQKLARSDVQHTEEGISWAS